MAEIAEFGTAPKVAAQGYRYSQTCRGTREGVLKRFEGQDVILVEGPVVFDWRNPEDVSRGTYGVYRKPVVVAEADPKQAGPIKCPVCDRPARAGKLC